MMSAQAQGGAQSLDQYIEQGKTIIIGKCLHVGIMKASLVWPVEIEVLQVLKGEEKDHVIVVVSLVGMHEGATYLLRIEQGIAGAL
jgi:hypothetical protein